MSWDGDEYQARFDALAASGTDVHGEATFVRALAPATVLDAGCGSGRVAIELARHGIAVTGVDLDPSMLRTARERAPELEWIEGNLAEFALEARFDAIVMAGNVMLFTPPGTHAAVVANCARHLAPGGALVTGFSLERGYALDDYDAHCSAAGLGLSLRFATWDGKEFPGDDSYAVSVHQRR